ncbi:MAG: hypothetical protein H6Q68_3153 [Firmicutes bacterium]|nr:hypothetical protein [Bacillota bacterium]
MHQNRKGDHKYTFRLTTIKSSGNKVIKDAICALPITPLNYYGYIIYDFSAGHFVYDSQGFAFFEHIEAGMNVHIYKDGVWSQGLFDARNVIKAEFIDGDLYWAGAGQLNYTITSYKNLTVVKLLDFTNKFKSLLGDFKSYAQGVLDGHLLQHGTQKYIIADNQITKGWSAYYEEDDIRASFSIFLTPGIYESDGSYHSFVCAVDRYYLGNNIYQHSKHFEYDNILYINNEHTYIDTDIIYGVDRKYKILSTTQGTYYTLVDTVNNVTYDWTPFKDLLDDLLKALYGAIIVITEINTDTLYVYISDANFIFSKSQNTLTIINQSGFTLGNQQLTKISRGTAKKFIMAIKDELGV